MVEEAPVGYEKALWCRHFGVWAMEDGLRGNRTGSIAEPLIISYTRYAIYD
jgi:hypothetical protein